MAIKKSELYSSLWASCDQLRGSMDASQYKDYVLVMLFIKYISDRYAGQPYAAIKVPLGSTFQDMVALKGAPTIGDDINKKIIGPIKEVNNLSDMPDFNDPNKLGVGNDMVRKLTNLITIFENPSLDFKGNRADGDDILGDAYEYLMRHFATESGRSKGQFYTPAEVSRVMAKIIGINAGNSTSETSVYDPTCGSGSLLLKVADEAGKLISVFGQENDSTTAALSRMNMILHDNPTAVIKQGNTMSNPLFRDANGRIQRFDYVVANPPFSFSSWINGVNVQEELSEGGRFYGFGEPPVKNGDYAFLLHIVKSLKSNGKGAIVLPHGVLFRGGAEAEIRRNLIKAGLIKGIIGLPANLFYGTTIAACLILIDKENASSRKGIFMVDASNGFMKDGNMNRLRERDIHKIVDVFNKFVEIPKYSRMISLDEIEKNGYGLSLSLYIDSSDTEDIQSLAAHLQGGIPNVDIEALQDYWEIFPSLKEQLFKSDEEGNVSKLKVTLDELQTIICSNEEFIAYSEKVSRVFEIWRNDATSFCQALREGGKPRQVIHTLSENILATFSDLKLIDAYGVYQYLMNYWQGVMQDDCYLIVNDGWDVGKEVEWSIGKKDFEGRLLPKSIIINHYFDAEQQEIKQLEREKESLAVKLSDMKDEYGGEDGYFPNKDSMVKKEIQKRLKEILMSRPKSLGLSMAAESEFIYGEQAVLEEALALIDCDTEINKKLKNAISNLENALLIEYKRLTKEVIKDLVIQSKWMASIESVVSEEMQQISQRLSKRIKELELRYEKPLPILLEEMHQWQDKVNIHLQKMGLVWNN